MNSRSSSFSFPTTRLQQRPSFSARLSSAIQTVEHGEAVSAPGVVEHQIDEEIDEIKRYEVCVDIPRNGRVYLRTNSLPGFHNNR